MSLHLFYKVFHEETCWISSWEWKTNWNVTLACDKLKQFIRRSSSNVVFATIAALEKVTFKNMLYQIMRKINKPVKSSMRTKFLNSILECLVSRFSCIVVTAFQSFCFILFYKAERHQRQKETRKRKEVSKANVHLGTVCT